MNKERGSKRTSDFNDAQQLIYKGKKMINTIYFTIITSLLLFQELYCKDCLANNNYDSFFICSFFP